MSTADLRNAILSFHTKLDQRQQVRRAQRIQRTKAEQETPGDSLSTFSLSPDVKAYFDMVMQSVMQNRQRFSVISSPVSKSVPPSEPTEDGISQSLHAPADVYDNKGENTPPATIENMTAPSPLVSRQVASSSIFLASLTEQWTKNEDIVPTGGAGQNLSPPVRACLYFMLSEFSLMSEELSARGTMSNALISKLKQAIQAYSEGRTTDTITLLRNALSSDPHNHTLLAILSQIFYQMAAGGQQNALPEARDAAQRSIIHSDKVKPQRLALYRYLAMATEREFGPERTLEWLRDTGFLHPSPLLNKEGFMSAKGLHLRGWALLAGISPALWNEDEFNALYKLVDSVIGGGALYLAWFRAPLLEFAMLQKSPPPIIMEIERLMRTSYMFYMETAQNMRQLPLQASPHPWFIRVRFLNSVTQICPVPTFDQILCMVSLDGLMWKEDAFPDQELQALLGDPSLSYWKLWALVVTPHRDVRQPYLLPAEETVNDGPLLTACDTMLQALKEAETQRVRPAIWEDLKPWMVRWQIDHLLAAGSGSNKPRTRFAPNLVPYSHFYRNWQDPIPVGILASEIITENAKRGAFASLFEVAAAFEGALRIIDDPVHGLIACQKRALQAAKQQNPKKFANINVDFGSVDGGKVMMGLLPLGALGGMAAIIQMSANWSQAVGLMLALAGLAGVVMVNLSKK